MDILAMLGQDRVAPPWDSGGMDAPSARYNCVRIIEREARVCEAGEAPSFPAICNQKWLPSVKDS
jgi:hypothetical protein